MEDFPSPGPALDEATAAEFARAGKVQTEPAFHSEEFEWILFLAADCLCLRSIDHLVAGRDCDLLYQPHTGRAATEAEFGGYLTPADESRRPPPRWGISSEVWAVRGNRYRAVMETWARIQAEAPLRETPRRDESAWTRLVLDAAQYGWRAEPFEAHEVQFPLGHDGDWKLYRDAAIIHAAGVPDAERLEFLFGIFMQRFFFDPAGTLLHLVEM
jgi:hypothetical protein